MSETNRGLQWNTLLLSAKHITSWARKEARWTKVSFNLVTGSLIPIRCHVKYGDEPLVKGKHVTGFTNGEEEEIQLTKVVPFLVEDELLRLGAIFEKKANWQPFSITDGHLITGQNSASSTSTAQALMKLMTQQIARATAAS